MLLPEHQTTPQLVEAIGEQVFDACRRQGISVIGGHTEITHGLERPLLCGTLIGEVARDRLVTPRGMQPGDHVLLTKGVPIEGAAILAREFPERLGKALQVAELATAQNYLHEPGISVLKDAQIALKAGTVTAMHDPTEGGLATALWEMAEAGERTLLVERTAVPIPALAKRICEAFDLDPLATIASGALLLTVPPEDATAIRRALVHEGIDCAVIGRVAEGPASVKEKSEDGRPWPRPDQDAIGQVYGDNH
jgi:hydrogenase maturation factor